MADSSLQDELEQIVSSFPRPQMAMLPALRHASRKVLISDEVLAIIGGICEVEEDAVRAFLSAYPSLCEPSRAILVCGGLSCLLNGAKSIFADPTAYGLAVGGFEQSSACLGYCFVGPVVRLADGTVIRAHRTEQI